MVLMIGTANQGDFLYDGSGWTAEVPINPTLASPNVNQHMKNPGYWSLAVAELLIVMGTPETYHLHALTAASAKTVFTGAEISVANSRDDFFRFVTAAGVSTSQWDNQPYWCVVLRKPRIWQGAGRIISLSRATRRTGSRCPRPRRAMSTSLRSIGCSIRPRLSGPAPWA